MLDLPNVKKANLEFEEKVCFGWTNHYIPELSQYLLALESKSALDEKRDFLTQ